MYCIYMVWFARCWDIKANCFPTLKWFCSFFHTSLIPNDSLLRWSSVGKPSDISWAALEGKPRQLIQTWSSCNLSKRYMEDTEVMMGCAGNYGICEQCQTWLSKLWKKLNFFFKFEFLKEINRIHNNNKQRMIKYGNK